MTIFDLVTAKDIAAYWDTLSREKAPYFFETMFPADKKLGLDLSYIKGKSGLPAVLKISAFDVKAIPRERIGFDKLTAEMPYFKESMYIDEKLRQELNLVLQTGNQQYIDTIMNRIFADEIQLLESARVTRERMRAMAMTTGAITMADNGQVYTYDYQMPNSHKYTATTFNTADFDIAGYLNDVCDTIEQDTGTRPNRAVVSRSQWNKIKANTFIAKNIYVLTNGTGTITDDRIKQYLEDNTGITFSVYTKKYRNESKQTVNFVPDDLVVLYPEGKLGNTWFGTTPEESDLMSGANADVSIVDTGVAVTTFKEVDPVTVQTKVSMICLPSFEQVDTVALIDTSAE
jgi:hypothetical protein